MIYIQTLDKKWSPGSKMLANQTAHVRKAFEMFIAYSFIEEVKHAISTQKYKSKWKPLSPNYLAFKKRRGLSPFIWESTTQLKKTLSVYGSSNMLTIGWDKRLLHNKSKYPLYKIARNLEMGTLKIPPRPLFRFIYNYMSKNISRFWDSFTREYLGNVDPSVKVVMSKDVRKTIEKDFKRKKLSIQGFLKFFKKRGG